MKEYSTNCSLPPANITDSPFYVSTPNVRGSLQIVWTCLFTLIVCVYQVLHLSIPDEDDLSAYTPRWRQSFSKFLKAIDWRSFKWAVVAVIAPEAILTSSAIEFYEAWTRLRKIREHVDEKHKNQWTLTHMFYANLGGFVVKREEDLGPLTIKALVDGIKDGTFAEMAPISKHAIDDWSKENLFTKSIAVLQIVYFFMEFFVRVYLDQAVSQLELGVVSIAFYSLFSYGFLFSAPKGVETRTSIEKARARMPERQTRSGLRGLVSRAMSYVSSSTSTNEAPSQGPRARLAHWATNHSFANTIRSQHQRSGLVLFILTSIPLGAGHLAGWNIEFPTDIDLWLWRYSSAVSTAAGPAAIAITVLAMMIRWAPNLLGGNFWSKSLDDGLDRFVGIFWTASMVTILLAYVGARLVLIVEMIRCLFYLPVGVFEATSWVMAVPHFG